MTNFEKWKDTITNVEFAMVDGELTNCDEVSCMYCSFLDDYSCINARWEWLKDEYKEPKIDWSAVEVDTQILVSTNGRD